MFFDTCCRFAAESPTAASRSKVLISKGKRLGDLSYFTVTAHLLPSGDIRFSAVSARDAGLVFKRTVTVSELATLSGETCDSESSISRAVSVLPSRITLTDGTLDFVTKPPSSRCVFYCLGKRTSVGSLQII